MRSASGKVNRISHTNCIMNYRIDSYLFWYKHNIYLKRDKESCKCYYQQISQFSIKYKHMSRDFRIIIQVHINTKLRTSSKLAIIKTTIQFCQTECFLLGLSTWPVKNQLIMGGRCRYVILVIWSRCRDKFTGKVMKQV